MITPVPRVLAARGCKICLCTDERPCWDAGEPCFWVFDDLCSRCTRKLVERALRPVELVRDPMELLSLGRDPEPAA